MTGNYKDKGRAVILAALMVLSVFAMAVTVPGAVVADHESENPREATDFSTGDRVWKGQIINYSDSVTDDEYAIYKTDGDSDELVREIAPDSESGNLVIDTTNLESGDYTVNNSSDNEEFTFSVRDQDLSVEFSDEEVVQGGSSTLAFDSVRNGFNVSVTADGLDHEDLEDVFQSYTGQHNDSENNTIYLHDVGSTQEIDLDFSNVSVDSHTFEIEVVDTGVTSEATIDVTNPGDTQVEFDERTVSGVEGDVAEITVNFENEDTAEIQLGSEDDGWKLNATVEDTEDNGNVTLLFNTFHAGDNSSTGNDSVLNVKDDEGSVSVISHDNLSGDNLALGGYDMRLSTDELGTTDRGTFRLVQGSVDNAWTWTAPVNEDIKDVEDLEEVGSASDTIAQTDWAVVEVEASGIYGYWDAHGDNNVSMEFEHTNPGRNKAPAELDASSLEVLDDPANERFYVLVDTDAEGLEDGQNWEFTFTVGEDNRYVEEDQSVSTSFTVEERTVEFDADDYDVAADEGQEITGTSNLAAGSMLDLAAEAGGDNPFFTTANAEVNADGEWTAEFDFSGQAVDTEFDLDVDDREGDASDEATGTITEAGSEDDSQFDVNVDGPEEVDAGEDAVYTVTVTNNGDEAADACVQFELDGETYDGCGLTIDAGASDSVDFTVDTEGLDGDYAWSVDLNDETVEEGTLTVNADGGEDDSGSTDSDGNDSDGSDSDGDDSDGSDSDGDDSDGDDSDGDDSDGDDSSSDDSSDDDSSDGDDDGQPGFGVAVALVALLAAAMLALRRQN